MKMSKIKLLIVFCMVLSFIFFPTCKRKQSDEFSPFGPSSLSIILKLSASPNVIAAGSSRETTTLTASLRRYNSTPIAGKTVHFEIRDEFGNKLYLGHFQGNKSVVTQTTDENGEAKAVYRGPLGEEVTDTTYVYIYASVSWEGKEFFTDLTPIKVVRDQEQLIIDLVASPSVMVADTYRAISTIKATVSRSADKIIANEPILFEITDSTGVQLNLGYFEDFRSVYETKTNMNGVARVEYFGPIAQEITADTTVYIKAWLPGQTDAPSTSVAISIVRESKDVTIELFAEPNVLVVSDESGSSILKAYVKKGTMPLPDRRVVFTVSEGEGTFSNSKDNIMRRTNEEGIAIAEYRSPTEDDITADQVVTITAQVEASGSFVTDTATIQLVRDAADYSLELTADPLILWIGEDNPTSYIKAVLKEGDNPIPQQEVFFQITTGSGEFSNELTADRDWTDSEGMAIVTYVAPNKHEITADETVTITAQVSTSDSTILSATVDIELILAAPALTLEIEADPNILVVTSTRAESTITITFKQGSTPLANRKIIFTLPDGLGQFHNGLKTFETRTDSNGTIITTYYAPTTAELTANQTIDVKAQASTSSPEDFITATVQIQLVLEQ